MDRERGNAERYWTRNKQLIAVLLSIWFLVSFVLPYFLAGVLEESRVGQLPAPFWWAQQGSMFVFVILIFVYAFAMDRLDRRYGVGEDRSDEEKG